ncbi:Ctr-domain-containing protein [Mollisia scopiformis]|uniref:Copper transport protein n=1 Tax=Mollisia scopiformis TaxID=149040 RepID=A0A194XT27_MOLSC|nr:Ctr-domain-containing protein [Mollisia scopiformis]KUJ23199.1 Ctr-domain-containing protein [Mollisia scopiformis]
MDMDMVTAVATSSTSMVMSMATSTAAASAATTAMAMSMGGSTGCKLSMLLNWNTIDACFLFSAFHIRSSFNFFLACLGSFLLVISLELLRRFQREFDRHLQARKSVRQEKEYVLPEEMEEKLLDKGGEGGDLRKERKERLVVVMLEQILRGLIHMVQFSVSYCIMLLFMYSNGYIITSIIFGALVGFALFTRDTLHSPTDDIDDREKACC